MPRRLLLSTAFSVSRFRIIKRKTLSKYKSRSGRTFHPYPFAALRKRTIVLQMEINPKFYSPMKPIAAFALGFFGLEASVLAVSSEKTNGKLTLGDPIPEITAQDQDAQLR